jgi:hypothetical protein
MSLPTYVLAGFSKTRQSNEAAVKYAIIGAMSSAVILYAISLAYGLTGYTQISGVVSGFVNHPSALAGVATLLFIAGFGPIVEDAKASRKLYRDTLGIDFDEANGYLHTDKVEGAKSFALWPLSQAAESCFGTTQWPKSIPIPQAWLEFDVENLEHATRDLQDRGYRLLVERRTEPWGQTVTRLLSPEGLLVGVTHTPWMRNQEASS